MHAPSARERQQNQLFGENLSSRVQPLSNKRAWTDTDDIGVVKPTEPPCRLEHGKPYAPPDKPEESFIPDRGFDGPA
jgi:hypothetical protein